MCRELPRATNETPLEIIGVNGGHENVRITKRPHPWPDQEE